MTVFQAPILPANPKDSDWKYFIQKFNKYIIICDANTDQQFPLLLNYLGQDVIDVFDGLPEPKGMLEEEVKTHFAEHFNCQKSLLFRQKAFCTAMQGQFEVATDHACHLRCLATDCDFGVKSTLLQDILVIGVHSDHIGECLLTEDAVWLTFESAVVKAKAAEHTIEDHHTHAL